MFNSPIPILLTVQSYSSHSTACSCINGAHASCYERGRSDGQWVVSKTLFYLLLSRPLDCLWASSPYLVGVHPRRGSGWVELENQDRIWHALFGHCNPQLSSLLLAPCPPSYPACGIERDTVLWRADKSWLWGWRETGLGDREWSYVFEKERDATLWKCRSGGYST